MTSSEQLTPFVPSLPLELAGGVCGPRKRPFYQVPETTTLLIRLSIFVLGLIFEEIENQNLKLNFTTFFENQIFN